MQEVEKRKKQKFNWEGVQNATGASILTGLTTPFILAPFDAVDTAQNLKALGHMPKDAPIKAMYKELLKPEVLKTLYTKAVPARLIKNVPAQIATLGSFSVFKELLNNFNPPDYRLQKEAAFGQLATTAGTALWRGAKTIGKTLTNQNFYSGLVGLQRKGGKYINPAAKLEGAAYKRSMPDVTDAMLRDAAPELFTKPTKFFTGATFAGMGANMGIHQMGTSNLKAGNGLKEVYKNTKYF